MSKSPSKRHPRGKAAAPEVFRAEDAENTQVLFIVVATGADGAASAQLAREVADEDPFARKVVQRGDPGFPSAARIAQLTAGVADPGAIVLRRDGTLSEVLDREDAQNPAAITEAFLAAFGGVL